ncbi:MAG: hypothetical protein IT170_18830 [Bryobacterales bacterium]|nr:hypothetical protein [Bryobacterales bacterium]
MTDKPAKTGSFETLLVSLDGRLFGRLGRVAVGFVMIPALTWVRGTPGPDWALVAALLAVLFLIRLIPLVVRRLMPTSQAVRHTWAHRRQLAKRYDSYQWQKLFWIGTGLALYIAVSRTASPARLVVSSFCLLAGALGIARWRQNGSRALRAKPVRKET